MSDAPNLQHLVYDVDVTVASTECNLTPTQAQSVGETVIKCHCKEAPLCGEVGSMQGNSQLSVLPHRQRHRQHEERENNEINRFDKLTS